MASPFPPPPSGAVDCHRDAGFTRTYPDGSMVFGPAEIPDFIDLESFKAYQKLLFEQSHPPVSIFLTPDHAIREARQRSKNICETWAVINRILEHHEAIIQKRWTKKTKEQRRKILLTAWPGMSTHHRPDMGVLSMKSERNPDPTNFPEAFKWPHINQEDLTKPKLFLIFLNARGRHFPSAFANADKLSYQLGANTGKLEVAVLFGYTMFLTGRNTPETYGELVKWEKDNDAFEHLTATKRGWHPGEGLQVLEIQERVYKFLETCCCEILHDISVESLAQGHAPILPEPPAISSTAEDSVNSLADMAAEAPYRLPARLDFTRLHGLIAAKTSAAKDHLWSLREDPGYFAEMVLEAKEHRRELLPCAVGHKDLLTSPYPSPAFWDKVLGSVVCDAYVSIAVWDDLLEQTATLQLMFEEHKNDIAPDKDYPLPVLFHVILLYSTLCGFKRNLIHKLGQISPASPPRRSQFSRWSKKEDPTRLYVSIKSDMKDKKHAHLSWLISILCDPGHFNDYRLIKTTSICLIMDEMDRFIQSDWRVRDMLSASVASAISDVSVATECLHQISLYDPCLSAFDDEVERYREEITEVIRDRLGNLLLFEISLESVSWASLGDPSDGKFDYPVEKRKTRENTRLMQFAETNLDKFWKKVDDVYNQEIKFYHYPALVDLLSGERTLERTPDWIEPEPKARSTDRKLEKFAQSDVYFELERRTQRTIANGIISSNKAKVKTRGTPGQTESRIKTLAQAVQNLDVQPTVAVDKRAHKVFSNIFYSPSRTSKPGEVPWGDFLHAMRTAGFAIEKLYGSVWQFTPSTMDIKQSIQFHEPHPIAKIPFRMARRYGRRLTRAYGWTGDSFRIAK